MKTAFNLICPPAWHPSALAKRKLHRVARGQVLAGPFAGMRYADESAGSAFEPKLLGTYELELRPVIERLCAADFKLIVNVGAGEGYYAVGMATRCEGARVVAFESDEHARALIRQMAEMNGVEDRIRVEGLCEPEALARILPADSLCLLIMDVEGGELSLLNPETLPPLKDCHILVELHDFIRPDTSAEIEARFNQSHTIEKIRQRGRALNDLPFRDPLLDRWVVRYTDEQRPVRMEWFYMRPRGRSSRTEETL